MGVIRVKMMVSLNWSYFYIRWYAYFMAQTHSITTLLDNKRSRDSMPVTSSMNRSCAWLFIEF